MRLQFYNFGDLIQHKSESPKAIRTPTPNSTNFKKRFLRAIPASSNLKNYSDSDSDSAQKHETPFTRIILFITMWLSWSYRSCISNVELGPLLLDFMEWESKNISTTPQPWFNQQVLKIHDLQKVFSHHRSSTLLTKKFPKLKY